MWLSAQRGWLGSLSCRKERVSESWWEQAPPDRTPKEQEHLGNAETIKNARGADLKVKSSTSHVNTSAVTAAGTVSKQKHQKQIWSFSSATSFFFVCFKSCLCCFLKSVMHIKYGH